MSGTRHRELGGCLEGLERVADAAERLGLDATAARHTLAEARVTRDSKTDDWVKLDYESLREGSTFVTFGAVVK